MNIKRCRPRPTYRIETTPVDQRAIGDLLRQYQKEAMRISPQVMYGSGIVWLTPGKLFWLDPV